MKAHFLGVVALAACCGCSHKPAHKDEPTAWLPGARLAYYQAEAVDNAVIREHTVYPYYFGEGRAELNELGRRDVTVLAEHFSGHEGTLNVRRGDAPPPLYAARCNAVLEALAAGGVDPKRMTLADGLPGGDGMGSRWVVFALRNAASEESLTPDQTYSQPVPPEGGLLDNLMSPQSSP